MGALMGEVGVDATCAAVLRVESRRRTAVLGVLLSAAAVGNGLGQVAVVEAIRGAVQEGALSAAGTSLATRVGFLVVAGIYALLVTIAALAGVRFWFHLGVGALADGLGPRSPGANSRRAAPGTRWTFAKALMVMAVAGLGVRVVSPVFAELAWEHSHDGTPVTAALGEPS
jgi:hypothetical protein